MIHSITEKWKKAFFVMGKVEKIASAQLCSVFVLGTTNYR